MCLCKCRKTESNLVDLRKAPLGFDGNHAFSWLIHSLMPGLLLVAPSILLFLRTVVDSPFDSRRAEPCWNIRVALV